MKLQYRIIYMLSLLLISINLFASNIILVTGFEPFGSRNINGSWEAVKNLNGKQIGNKEIVVAMLPVLWDVAATKLHDLVKTHQPVMIISFGEAAGFPVRLETTAQNVRGKYRDNDSKLPSTRFIYRDGPDAVSTALPISIMQSALNNQNLPFMLSNDAGTYLCNEIFYTLMHDPGTEEAKIIPRGFVHVPSYMSRIKNKNGEIVVFDQVMLQLAAESIITAVARYQFGEM